MTNPSHVIALDDVVRIFMIRSSQAPRFRTYSPIITVPGRLSFREPFGLDGYVRINHTPFEPGRIFLLRPERRRRMLRDCPETRG